MAEQAEAPQGRRATRQRNPPAAAGVLRRALLGWGLGHLALGDRRGWLLLLLQPLAILLVGTLALELIDSTRWILAFPAVAGLIVAWLAQAIHAHQLAVARGARPGGELQIAFSLPLVLVVLTAYWLVGGSHASPAATLQGYVADWQAGRTAAAAQVFVEAPAATDLAAQWQAQLVYVRQRVGEAARIYGGASGLDPDDPFASLRFIELAEPAGETTSVAVDIVRRERVETTLLGLIPTATQQTVLVERAGIIRLRAVPAELPAWLPAGRPAPSVWLIEEVVLPLPPGG